MFSIRYWARRFFPRRYFPGGQDAAPAVTLAGTFVAPAAVLAGRLRTATRGSGGHQVLVALPRPSAIRLRGSFVAPPCRIAGVLVVGPSTADDWLLGLGLDELELVLT